MDKKYVKISSIKTNIKKKFSEHIYYDYTHHILLLGSVKSGKTTFIENLKSNYIYDFGYHPTIGIDFYSLKFYDKEKNDFIKCNIWDTGGEELIQPHIHSIYNKATIVILIYDITNRISFTEVKYWYSQIMLNMKKNIPIFLIGNKIDKYEKRVVSVREGEQMAKLMKATFFETSMKCNRIQMLNLLKDIIYHRKTNNYSNKYNISDNINETNKLISNHNNYNSIHNNTCINNGDNNCDDNNCDDNNDIKIKKINSCLCNIL